MPSFHYCWDSASVEFDGDWSLFSEYRDLETRPLSLSPSLLVPFTFPFRPARLALSIFLTFSGAFSKFSIPSPPSPPHDVQPLPDKDFFRLSLPVLWFFGDLVIAWVCNSLLIHNPARSLLSLGTRPLSGVSLENKLPSQHFCYFAFKNKT